MMDRESCAPFLNLTIKTTFNGFCTERRYAANMSVIQLKRLLEGITGASPASMQLLLLNKDGSLMGALSSDQDEVQLASAGLHDGMTIQVSDPFVKLGEFEDISNVKKFELSEEEYSNRPESLRLFKQNNKLGQFSGLKMAPEDKAKEASEKEVESRKQMEKIDVGNRCMVTLQGQLPKKGTIMYKGFTNFKPGCWVGVKYDEPLGRHDGSVDGKRYFECAVKYGAFVKPDNVVVGDYPEDDLIDEM